jgi:glycosyltransferase involved in cell wall biosynthesis
MSAALVSCIVPVRNGERYLGEALDSVLAQTHRDLEVVVVDDGSTDGSAGVAEAFGDPVRVIRFAETMGTTRARAAGVRVAAGGLVAFLDADDLWEPERLAVQAAHLEEGPGLDVSFCEIENFWEQGQQEEAERWRAAGRLRGTWMIIAALARREVLDRVPLPDRGRYTDHLRWSMGLRESELRIGLLPRVLVHRRRHDGNLSRTEADAHFDELFDVLKASVERHRGVH